MTLGDGLVGGWCHKPSLLIIDKAKYPGTLVTDLQDECLSLAPCSRFLAILAPGRGLEPDHRNRRWWSNRMPTNTIVHPEHPSLLV
jgi:hypothetical protein